MNFSTFHRLPITGHKDIDFVDIRLETDTSLYVDPERIALSNHPISASASHCIDDFFATLCQVAAERNSKRLYDMLSFGREPNETHLGLSACRSQGRGTSPEILMPIVEEMIREHLFDKGLITQLGDLHLWTPNFGYDRLSDLTTNIIRAVLIDYTLEQYEYWGISNAGDIPAIFCMWNSTTHRWERREFPRISSGSYQTLLVPKCFVGRRMLSSPGELLQKYALRYRQQEHLDIRSDLCHRKVDKNGVETWKPPAKKEIRAFEMKGTPDKAYLLEMGHRYPRMVDEFHADHRFSYRSCPQIMSDYELDKLLYGHDELAV